MMECTFASVTGVTFKYSQSPTAAYADFGFTEKLASPASLITSVAGKLPYMAPEVMSTHRDWERIKERVERVDSTIAERLNLAPFIGSGYGKASDMWSLGMVLFEMLFGYLPCDNSDPLHYKLCYILSMNVNNPNQHGQVSNECMELIHNLLIVDTNERYKC